MHGRDNDFGIALHTTVVALKNPLITNISKIEQILEGIYKKGWLEGIRDDHCEDAILKKVAIDQSVQAILKVIDEAYKQVAL